MDPLRGRSKPEAELDTLVDSQLPSRLVFSLLTPAVRLASRLGMPLQRFAELARLAYFAEERAKHPDSLAETAAALGLSTRHTGTLNRQLKQDFFQPQHEVAPLRRITSLLLVGSLTEREIERAMADVGGASDDDVESEDRDGSGVVRQALEQLLQLGWVKRTRHRYELAGNLRSLVDDALVNRLDALNHQLEVVGQAVWHKFIAKRPEAATARTWTFASKADAFRALAEQSVRTLRNAALDLEEDARAAKVTDEYAVTVVFTALGDERAPKEEPPC